MEALKKPARMEHLEEMLAFVSTRAREKGMAEKRILEVELALEESLVNIINYAYPDKDGTVEIRCVPSGEGKLLIEIRDQGIPFDIFSMSAPDLDAVVEERAVGGLGIYLIRQLTRVAEYRREGRTNVLSLLF
ncbi:MAG TPA: ATP-binding protein [Syntrophales bacterium]|nr:ATP-binding protein [Syntrophales bacterium]HQB31457.1 ATP-binding protein [Syntrophales bacterium]HQN77251.1 ATP-binding protein [Syntrophales bacterium]